MFRQDASSLQSGPSTTAHRRPLLVAFLGNTVEWYDANLYGLLAIYLAKAFFAFSDPVMGLAATYATFVISFVIRPVSGLLLGRLADLRGHRFVLIMTVNLMTIGTVGMGLLPTYATIGFWSPALLVLCRVMQGIGASAEYTVATSYVLEQGPRSRAQYLAGWCIAACNLGPLLASAVAMALTTFYGESFFETGAWRYPFLLSAPLGLVAIYLRSQMEDDGLLHSRAPDDQKKARVPLFIALRGHWLMVLKLVAMGAGNRAASAILQGYIVTSLIHQGFAASTSMLASLLVYLSGFPAVIFAGYLSDKLGGRRVLIATFAVYAAVLIPLFHVMAISVPAMLIGVVIFSVINNFPASALAYAYIMTFPQAVRGAAAAVNYNLGTAFIGSTAPLVATWLVARTGTEMALAWYLAAWCVVSCIAAVVAYPRELTAAADSRL